MGSSKVQLIIVLSGKRKSGKDFVTDEIVKNFGTDKTVIIRTSRPIKTHFAKIYGLDLQEMMTASNYKEKVREEMVAWGEAQRKVNPYVFCESVVNEAETLDKPIWIVSDSRRFTDLEFFQKYALNKNITLRILRVNSDIKTRKERGWKFTAGIDDAATECQLDSFTHWDVVLENSCGDDVVSDVRNLCHELLS